jgi:rhodanese-related sulfurtransferase
MQQVDPAGLREWLDGPEDRRPGLLDVREPWELERCVIEGSVAIPMGEIPQRVGDLDPGRDWVVVCHHGMRSLQVALFLERNGFQRMHNLRGGIDAWAAQVDPAMPRY